MRFSIFNSQFSIGDQTGSLMVYNVVIIFIFSVVLVAILGVATSQLRTIRGTVNKEMAFQIAEAGANYYEWHLSHFLTDYADGTGASGCNPCGPYVHNFEDSDTHAVVGKYSLLITPPAVGSTIVTVSSTGYALDNPNQKRTVTVRYGIDSLAKYAFLTNDVVWIGPSESVNGKLHSNGGIRFDGTGNDLITSAKSSYTCVAKYQGSPPCPATVAGIWGSAPTSTKDFWQYPVANIDFSSINANLAQLKSTAQTDGAPAYLSASNKQGYSFVFTPNGKVNIYLVKKVLSAPSPEWDVNGTAINTSADYDPSQLQLLYNQVLLPSSGIFYVEDNVWVEGTVNGRVQVVAAKLPYNASTAPKIYIPNNLRYNAYNACCSIGLLGQKDIAVSYNAPTNLRIDAAMIAQNGSIQVYEYANGTNVKNSITVFGSIISYGPWTWSYVNSSGVVVSGYQNTTTNYDTSLLYAPPPGFPITSSGYQQLNWTSN